MSLVATGGRGEDRICQGPICTLNYKKVKVGEDDCVWCAHDQARIKTLKKANGEKPCKRCSQEQIGKRKK
jgi:hypothetical protein